MLNMFNPNTQRIAAVVASLVVAVVLFAILSLVHVTGWVAFIVAALVFGGLVWGAFRQIAGMSGFLSNTLGDVLDVFGDIDFGGDDD